MIYFYRIFAKYLKVIIMKVLKFAVLLLIVLSSCLSDPIEIEKVEKRSLLVYLAGDNNLSNEVSEKSKSILAGWKPYMGGLFVFGDIVGKEKPFLMQANYRNGVAVYDTIKTYSNTNSASKELFAEVINDFKNNASKISKSSKYGMIMFSHATGWLPDNSYDNVLDWESKQDRTRSVFDDNSTQMEIKDLSDAIPDGMFEFIAADMCFMSGVEVAYALKDKTKYMLSSSAEILSPGFTHVYKTNLHCFYKQEPCLKGFANSFFNYFNSLSGVYRSATISIIKTSELDRLSSLVRKLHGRFKYSEIEKLQHFDRKKPVNVFFDLGDYLYSCADNDIEKKEIDNLLKDVVIFKLNTDRIINLDIKKHSGMTTYIEQNNLEQLNIKYKETDWYKKTFN